MATFESLGNPPSQGEDSVVKFPLRRLQLSVHKSLTVLKIDLERLDKHKHNIHKLRTCGDFQSLHKEQINASRTVQQLTHNMGLLEHTRNQVISTDLEEFDSQVSDIKLVAGAAAAEFCQLSADLVMCEVQDTAVPVSDPTSLQLQAELRREREQCEQAEQSWQSLEQNVSELNSLMQDLSSVVHTQHESVDSIEDHVITAQVNVEEGTSLLAQAARYKSSLLPVAGALLGGVVGGPIGLVAGLKVGGLVALGGGVVGFTGGRYMKQKQQGQVESDMADIVARREEQDKLDTAETSQNCCNGTEDIVNPQHNGS